MSILTLDMQAMLFPPETEEGGEESHVSTFQRLDAKVPDDLFHFLANMSSFSGEFTEYANAMVSSGYCKSAKTLKDMPADAIARMGARLKMPAKSIENLVAAIHKANSRYTRGNFERPQFWDPRFDKPKKEKKLPVHQLMQIFDAADKDRSGTVSAEELRKQLSTDKELQQMLGLKVRHPVRGLVAVIDMDSLLNNIDKDSSGVVSWGEWRDAVTHVSARKVFDEVDKDGSGTVSVREFGAALMTDQSIESLLGLQSDLQYAEKAVGRYGDHVALGKSAGTQLAIEKLLQVIDNDGSGTITWEEFFVAVKFQTSAHALDENPIYTEGAKLFKRLDTNQSGTLDRLELSIGLKADPTFVTSLGNDDALAMMLLDSDQSGEITWAEFEDMLKSAAGVESREDAYSY